PYHVGLDHNSAARMFTAVLGRSLLNSNITHFGKWNARSVRRGYPQCLNRLHIGPPIIAYSHHHRQSPLPYEDSARGVSSTHRFDDLRDRGDINPMAGDVVTVKVGLRMVEAGNRLIPELGDAAHLP